MAEPVARTRRGLVAASAGASPASASLVERLREGDKDAMAEVFREHLDAVYNYCYRRTGSWSAAEDVSSAVFLEVWRHRSRALEVNGSALPWVYGVATNLCRNHQRTQRRGDRAAARVQLLDGSDLDQHRDPGDAAAGRLDAHRRVQQVLHRVQELPQVDQDVFFLVLWEQLSYDEAATALAVPIGTVRSRLARVRRALRLTDITEADA